MMGIVTVIMVLAIGAAFVSLLVRRYRASLGRNVMLRQQIKNMLRMPDHMADGLIDERIRRLKKKHPDRPEQWYLEKILYDEQRDR